MNLKIVKLYQFLIPLTDFCGIFRVGLKSDKNQIGYEKI